MDRSKNLISSEIREIFQNQHDSLASSEGRKMLVSHFGEFSQDLVSSLSASAEELVTSSGDKRIIVKRLFSILVEGLQNIRLHGQHDEMGRQLGYVIVSRGKTDYHIVMANIMPKTDIEKVEKYIDEINDYSEEGLKEKYMAVLSNEFLSPKGGAGLGFIITRMKSQNPVEYSFYALKDDIMLFTFNVYLDR